MCVWEWFVRLLVSHFAAFSVSGVVSKPLSLYGFATWRPRGLSKWAKSRAISTLHGVTLVITLLITYLLSPLGPQAEALGHTRLLGPSRAARRCKVRKGSKGPKFDNVMV